MYIYSQCVCLMLQRMTGTGSSETGVTDGYKPQCWCWEPNPESSARVTSFLNYFLARVFFITFSASSVAPSASPEYTFHYDYVTTNSVVKIKVNHSLSYSKCNNI